MSRLNNVQREVTRGEILRQLAEWFPRWMSRRSLLNLLDLANCPLLDEDLDFHLEYLKSKKFLEFTILDEGVGKPKSIAAIRITSDGIDLLDGRKAGDTGVRI